MVTDTIAAVSTAVAAATGGLHYRLHCKLQCGRSTALCGQQVQH